MSQAHQSDAVVTKPKARPVNLAIWIVVGAIALVIGIILLAQFAIGAFGSRLLENDPAMAPGAIAKRIGPVAKLQFDGAAPVAPAADAPKVATATVTAAPAKAGKPDGKQTYDTACMACHATGAANAPKLGDKAAWAPRIKAGSEALYASVLKGKGAMPPKGGNAALGDADVKAAVDYMVAGSK